MATVQTHDIFILYLEVEQVLRSLAPRTFHAGVIITCAK